jgi:spore maturation protein CgeB
MPFEADDASRRILVTSTVPDRLNSNSVIRSYAAAGLRAADPAASIIECSIEAASDVARRLRPELILAIGGVAIDGGELRLLRRLTDAAGALLALWLHDDPYEMDYAFRAEEVADVIFTNDSWALFHYRHARVRHLPLAACPATHHRPVTDATRWTEMFFCGHGHANRVALLRAAVSVMSRHDVSVVGTGWPSDLRFATNRRLSPAEAADAANASVVTLNLPRVHNIANRRFDIPACTPGPRTFEVALAGSAQLVWSAGPEMTEYLKPGVEMVVLESVSDLADALERARDEPSYFLTMAIAAQQRVLASHCYEHRMRDLLAETFPGQRQASGRAEASTPPAPIVPDRLRAASRRTSPSAATTARAR